MNFIFKDNLVILLSEKNDLFAPICLLMTNESWLKKSYYPIVNSIILFKNNEKVISLFQTIVIDVVDYNDLLMFFFFNFNYLKKSD
jgi:hypothetical protein